MKNLKIAIVILSLTTIYLSHSLVLQAQTTTFQVAPARQELNLKPGEQTSLVIKFYNLSDIPMAGLIKAADFEVTDNKGTPTIIENAQQASPKFAASHWVELPYDRMTIGPEDKVTVQAKITVPENARPGGRYVAIYFEPTTSLPQSAGTSNEAGSGVSSRMASLIYINIPGDTVEKALVSQFFAPYFLEYGPIPVTTEILNRSDYHVRPKGIISLTNMFGGIDQQDKLAEQNIFPDVAREFTSSVGQKWMIGRYRLDLAASYGAKGQSLSRSIYVWVFPWKVASAILLTIVLVVIFGNKTYKKLIVKENVLEQEIQKEKDEIEELKKQLKKRDE